MNIVIGGTGIRVASTDTDFLAILGGQYADFIGPDSAVSIELNVKLVDDFGGDSDADVAVSRHGECWQITRGDFDAHYNPASRRGAVTQSANRHSIDSVIRIIHSLALAPANGFLLHAASAIRNDRAFLFAGRSGAGKTTLARLVPSDATLLSDEVSYIRKSGDMFSAWGTPFTGELGTPGENTSAQIAALYFLNQASNNRLLPIGPAEALRLLLMNVLFFAHDPDLVGQVFDVASDFVASVPAFRLDFVPDTGVWDLIQ